MPPAVVERDDQRDPDIGAQHLAQVRWGLGHDGLVAGVTHHYVGDGIGVFDDLLFMAISLTDICGDYPLSRFKRPIAPVNPPGMAPWSPEWAY